MLECVEAKAWGSIWNFLEKLNDFHQRILIFSVRFHFSSLFSESDEFNFFTSYESARKSSFVLFYWFKTSFICKMFQKHAFLSFRQRLVS